MDTVDKWYEHDPKTVVEKDDVTILYDIPIQADRTITANRPDIVIKNAAGYIEPFEGVRPR